MRPIPGRPNTAQGNDLLVPSGRGRTARPSAPCAPCFGGRLIAVLRKLSSDVFPCFTDQAIGSKLYGRSAKRFFHFGIAPSA